MFTSVVQSVHTLPGGDGRTASFPLQGVWRVLDEAWRVVVQQREGRVRPLREDRDDHCRTVLHFNQ